MKIWNKVRMLSIVLLAALIGTGCVNMNMRLAEDYADPLKEVTLEGQGTDKVVVIPIKGVITDQEQEQMMRKKPSLVKEVVSQLKKVEFDPAAKAVVLLVNSPGGSVTASDILYHEIKKLKIARDIPIVVCMMNVATSGGYYVSLPADHILAHKTTITGSVGVVFVRPKFQGLMEKIGVGIETSQSGKNKDMGSPFRPTTAAEEKAFQEIIDEMAALFKSRVLEHRKLSASATEEVMTAKIYTASQALNVGLIDEIGFTDDAIMKAKDMAGLDSTARVVMYRRAVFADDNIYNNLTAQSGAGSPMMDLGPLTKISNLKAGFYYTWPAMTE